MKNMFFNTTFSYYNVLYFPGDTRGPLYLNFPTYHWLSPYNNKELDNDMVSTYNNTDLANYMLRNADIDAPVWRPVSIVHYNKLERIKESVYMEFTEIKAYEEI